MLVVCMGDGLGNQMFQYAFYKALEKNYPDNKIMMDIFRIYGGNIHNGFELEKVFGIKVNECSKRVAFQLSDYYPLYKKRYWFINKIHGIRRYLVGKKKSFIIQDDPTAFYDEVFKLSKLNSYMFKGNWVNENYFKNIEEILRKDFTFPEFKDQRNIQYSRDMLNTTSVSVHIRKGDYLSTDMINLDIKYYIDAKNIIENNIENPKYYIFTDDKNAISEYLKIFPNYVLVEGNSKENSYCDMQLMTCCKHNIIANSTFSFWGAYLNSNKDKIVIAPSKAKKDFRHPFACENWQIVNID